MDETTFIVTISRLQCCQGVRPPGPETRDCVIYRYGKSWQHQKRWFFRDSAPLGRFIVAPGGRKLLIPAMAEPTKCYNALKIQRLELNLVPPSGFGSP